MPGALDANGVYQYAEDDPISPWSTFMNLLAVSVSNVLGALAKGTPAAGYAALAANSSVNATTTITTTPVDVPGLAVTVNLPAGRRIKITYDGMMYSSVAADRPQVGIREGSTLIAYSTSPGVGSASTGFAAHVETVLTPTPGAHTYKIAIGRASGTGNVNMVGGTVSPSSPSFLLVEDVGPVR